MIGAGFDLFRATGLHHLAAPLTRGLGVVLMFHHVRPWAGGTFAPNRGLEITPEHFESTLVTLGACGFEIVALDTAVERLKEGRAIRRPPFAVLTFDDGYRDNLEFALPILHRHKAPFTLFVTTGFADRSARLWWVELEQAIRRLSKLTAAIGGEQLAFDIADDAEKAAAWTEIYWRLRAQPEDILLDVVAKLAGAAGIDGRTIVEGLCMNWQELTAMAADPLCTIGAHTLSHPRLATCSETMLRRELGKSREILAEKFGGPVRHLAYPVGDPTSAGPREFGAAAEIGYTSAVTTRPGMLFADHAEHLMALPRLSINGEWQSRAALEILLSGAPFMVWNRGRRVAA
ncbi:MAG TPA: polysaccharide deacetylase family protein [Beijerinckiaceae bacterium]|nr:polysaccharide deacetylase family protein [Beijerinckiaceae bacterium]